MQLPQSQLEEHEIRMQKQVPILDHLSHICISEKNGDAENFNGNLCITI